MTTITLPDPSDESATMSIPEAAAMAGISRSSRYRAADKGEIPTIRIGGRRLVPTAVLYRMLVTGPDATD